MKKTVLLLAILLAGLVVAFSFKSSTSTPVEIKAISDDEEIIQMENDALDIAYKTMIMDGGPFENPFGGESLKPNGRPRYCITTAYFYTRQDRIEWVVDEAMGGWGNPNHVHYINFNFSNECAGACPSQCPCWSVSVATPC